MRRLGPYEVLDLLGQGGMGQVYRARHVELGVVRAVKVLRGLDPAATRRFEREALSLAAIKHPHVVRIHELDQAQDRLWFSMELIEGESLAEALARGRLPLERALAIARGVCKGLEVLHGAGIVHRDLKPGNVMLRPDGTPVILDLGLAWRDDQRLTQSGKAVGTLPYMAPEQIRGGEIGPATDVHAAGLLLFELLTGRPARQLDIKQPNAALLRQVLATRVPRPSRAAAGVPRAYDAVCLRATDADPARRYPDARALRRALDHPQTEDAAAQGASWQVGALVGVAVALLVGVVTYAVARTRAAPPPTSSGAAADPDAAAPLELAALRALLQDRDYAGLLREADRRLRARPEDPEREDTAELAWRARRGLVQGFRTARPLPKLAFVGEDHLVTAHRFDPQTLVTLYALEERRPERVRSWRLEHGGELQVAASETCVAVGSNRQVVLLDPTRDEPAHVFRGFRVYAMDFTPDGRHLAMVGSLFGVGQAVVVDAVTGAEVTRRPDPRVTIRGAAFADDQTLLLAGVLKADSPEANSILMRWSWQTDERVEWPRLEPLTCLGVYGPGVWVRGSSSGQVFVSQDEFVRDNLLRGADTNPLGEFQTIEVSHRGGVYWVEPAPEVGWVLTGSFDIGAVQGNEVRVWEPLSGREVYRLAALPATLSAVAVSPRSTRFAIAFGDEVEVWPLQPDPPTASARAQ